MTPTLDQVDVADAVRRFAFLAQNDERTADLVAGIGPALVMLAAANGYDLAGGIDAEGAAEAADTLEAFAQQWDQAKRESLR